MTDWLKKLKDYAPSIASAVVTGGATLPQLALKAVSDAMGFDVTNETELADVVKNATPEEMLKIKQSDNSFKIRTMELRNDLAKTEIEDVQNARKNNQHSRMPAIICCYLTLVLSGYIAMMFFVAIPENNQRMIDTLFGSFLTAWLASIYYWTGTTRSSAEKSKGQAK